MSTINEIEITVTEAYEPDTEPIRILMESTLESIYETPDTLLKDALDLNVLYRGHIGGTLTPTAAEIKIAIGGPTTWPTIWIDLNFRYKIAMVHVKLRGIEAKAELEGDGAKHLIRILEAYLEDEVQAAAE